MLRYIELVGLVLTLVGSAVPSECSSQKNKP